MKLDEIMALPVEQLAAADGASLSVVPERAAARGPRRDEGVGLHLQVQHRLAQGAQGRRLGRARRRLLFPQRHRADPVRRARQERAHARAGAAAGELAGDAQARAFAQARRAVRHHRGVLARARTSNCSRAARARAGRPGAIRPTTIIGRPGRPTHIIRRRAGSSPRNSAASASHLRRVRRVALPVLREAKLRSSPRG